MKLEARSVPITVDNGFRTQYGITPNPDHTVHVAMTGTFPVEDFTEKEILLTLPLEKKPVILKQIVLPGNEGGLLAYDIGGFGVLKIYDNACTFTSKSGKMVFTAPIPFMDKRDAICTGMTYHAIESRVVGGF